jgi:hypothetical protein
MQKAGVGGWRFEGAGQIRVRFDFPEVEVGVRLGWGLWLYVSEGVKVRVEDFEEKLTLDRFFAPNWGKAGSIWLSDGEPLSFSLVFESSGVGQEVALYDVQAGVVEGEGYEVLEAEPNPKRRRRLLGNMWKFAPEAVTVAPSVHVEVSEPQIEGRAKPVDDLAEIVLKSCNRCARFLPINVENERQKLSFSNHHSRPPCTHGLFGRLRDTETGDVLQLEYGFQLECRFCKKFEVNAAHNPQRTASQMKEDATRRRAIEVLLTELYQGSPSLLHRRRNGGRELAETVWRKFEGRCFKCGSQLASERDMHLDHTRPLALLWPLDGTATCLCATDNSTKRDQPPIEFYDPDELARLAEITGLTLEELRDPSPNREAIELLAARLDWFFEDFLLREDLQTERDGKLPADLLVAALQRAVDRLPDCELDLAAEYEQRFH